VLGQDAKVDMVGGSIRSSRDAGLNGARPKATDKDRSVLPNFWLVVPEQAQLTKIYTSFTNGNDIPHLKGNDSEAN